MTGDPHKDNGLAGIQWPKDTLGGIRWRLYVPRVSYETYRRGQHLTASLVTSPQGRPGIPGKFLPSPRIFVNSRNSLFVLIGKLYCILSSRV